MAEQFTGSGGAVRWTNYLVAAGGLVGMHVENVDGSTLARYFHKDHLGSVAVITDESGTVLERLSFDAWGKRRYPNGADDPSGSITSQTNRGSTGHEELDSVGLVHMNGRVCDSLLARFASADPFTENPFSTQGLEPLQLRWQQPGQLHRPVRLLLHGLLLAANLPRSSELPSACAHRWRDRGKRGGS